MSEIFKLNNSWDDIIGVEFSCDYYKALRQFLKNEYATKTIYPPMNDIYNALRYTDFDTVKVVILGQDPYHGEGQAHGLAFSVKEGVAPPPSLVNIFKEINDEFDCGIPKTANLTPWAKQGVLLLNTCLTVRCGEPNSHQGHGWEMMTDSLINALNKKDTPVVFMLWGANARSKSAIVTNPIHLVLECAHPSPLSAYRGFFGCKHFIKANQFLIDQGIEGINWGLA